MSRPETSRWDFSIRALNLLLQLFVTIYSIFGVLRSHFGASRAEGIRGRLDNFEFTEIRDDERMKY